MKLTEGTVIAARKCKRNPNVSFIYVGSAMNGLARGIEKSSSEFAKNEQEA
ncbi:MAG: hypothetical protein LBB47_07025 [Spirochaetaceae bacterium]|jgi:Uri superfamily endonuclease|nr:hypothetical protein [Spirochaetaceae bacterium]